MSEQENINITRKLFDALNSHDLRTGSQYLADNVQSIGTGMPSPFNKEKSQAYTQQFINAFPDLHFNIRQIIAQGDWVAVTYDAKGKHSAPLVTPTGDTIPTTGKVANVPGVTVLQFKNDKVVRQELYWDMATLLMQLGVITDFAQLSRMSR
jgi:steroid delta-isomerase-like uncharacterized protein